MTSYATENGLAANNTYPIYQNRQGTIWIGSWRGLTAYSGGAFKPVGEQYGVSDSLIMAPTEDREGGLWVGTWGDGVKRIKDGKATSYLPRDNLPVRTVRSTDVPPLRTR